MTTMASLEVMDYRRLQRGEENEIKKLVRACQESGIFYLNMTGTFIDLLAIYDSAISYFEQSPTAKWNDAVDGLERGFKQFDSSATFEIPIYRKNGGQAELPARLETARPAIVRLSSTCDLACRRILALLGTAMGQSFPETQRCVRPASTVEQTGLKLCYKDRSDLNEQTNGKAHTDAGVLTLLFYDQPTLQIVDPAKTDEWLLVQPREGCAVVNVADTLQKRTGGRLQSPLHRVVQPRGVRAARPSAVYFLRPEV